LQERDDSVGRAADARHRGVDELECVKAHGYAW
jgi:hypothetical protein